MENSICFYCAHFDGNSLPKYICAMLAEMKKHSKRLVLITEEKQWEKETNSFLLQKNIETLWSPNKGYDFGKWYWAFKKLNIDGTERIILMNDSMLLLSSLNKFFDWCNRETSPVKGLLTSTERAHHLQSYLMVLDKEAIVPTLKYFKKKKRYRKKRKVIRNYELGLSKFWKDQNLQIKAYHNIEEIKKGFDKNPNYFLVEKLLEQRTPLIKRHIIMDSFSNDMRAGLRDQNFNFDKNHSLEIIKSNYSESDYEALMSLLEG